MAAAGGVLLAAASVMGWSELEWVGSILFVAGVIWFFAAAIHRSRSEGISLVASLTRSAQDALRFAWYLDALKVASASVGECQPTGAIVKATGLPSGSST